MNRIDQLTDYSGQIVTMILGDGTSFEMTIVYKPMQLGWFIQNLTYGTFQVNGIRIYCGVNLLRQFKNKIPFGLCCTCVDNREPTQLQDFLSGQANLYVLSSDEVKEYETILNG